MSQTLAQTLIEEHLVTAGDVDEALRRQVVYGGSLDTNLLEMGVTEDIVLRALSEAHRLPQGERDDIDRVEAEIPKLFPLVFAETYRVVPFRQIGKNLGVLVNGPADPQLFSRIRERLQLVAAPTVTTEARMHYAMHRLYGVKLLPRFHTLLTQLDGGPPAEAVQTTASSDHVLSWGLSTTRIRPSRGRGETRKGAPDVAGLLARLDSGQHRDAIVEVLLEITLGTFEFVALFLVQEDRVNGWRGTDPETTQRVARISLPLELPSVFQTIYATRGHYLGPLPQNSTNAKLLQDMGREQPRAAFLAPMLVGGKLAGILYADNGARSVPSKRVSGVLLLTHRVGMCFENLIRKRKGAATMSDERAPVPSAQASAPPPSEAQSDGLASTIEQRAAASAVAAAEHRSDAPSLEAPLVASAEAPTPPPLAQDRVAESLADAMTGDWESVAYEDPTNISASFVVDTSPEAATAAFERGFEQASDTLEIDDEAIVEIDAGDYVAFADVDMSPEKAVDDWEDVLVDAAADAKAAALAAAPATRPAKAVSAQRAVSWADVVAEARRAPELRRAAAVQKIEVAGHVVDERDLLFDGLDALDAETRGSAAARLLELGEAMDEAIFQRFPGRIPYDPFDATQGMLSFQESGGLCWLLVARGASAAPLVVPHLDSDDRVKRFFAIYYLHAVHVPEALEPLARRLYDTEPKNRYLAADALRAYAGQPPYARVLQGLREQLKVPVLEVQVNTVQVLGQLRDPRAVPSLIPLVVSTQPELATAAASALAAICAQAFGRDVTRWAQWWQANYNKPRELWLVQGLRHPSSAVQEIAFSELQLLTGYTGSFDATAPPEEKEPQVAMWESWLQQLMQARASGPRVST